MNFLVIPLFIALFLSGYLAQRLNVIPSYWVLIPELLSAIAMVVFLGRLVTARSLALDWRYGLFLCLFLFVLLFGFLAQQVPAGAVVAGLRNYVKFLPFFLLAAIYPFTDRQLKVQLYVLMLMLVLQTPLAVYQRFVQFADSMHTGDPVRGMATTSSALTILMIGAIIVVVSLYLRRRIRLPLLLVSLAVFVVPTTLNETKSTLILLPVAMLVPALFMPHSRGALRKMLPLVAIGAVAVGAYVAVYNSLIQHRTYARDLGTFFTSGYVENYLYTGAADGEQTWIGRFDSISLAAQGISGDPLKVAFGLGAGNVSHSSSLTGFDGVYASYVDRYGVNVTQVSSFLWEIGVVGVCLFLLLYWFIFRDARLLSKADGIRGIYGQVWATVMIIMSMALVYKSILGMNEIAYLFWFYSGIVAREAYLRRRHLAPVSTRAGADATRTSRYEGRLGTRTALGVQ
jgi:hypothetical protein